MRITTVMSTWIPMNAPRLSRAGNRRGDMGMSWLRVSAVASFGLPFELRVELSTDEHGE